MVRPERIELPTSWFVAMHSIQLSYGRIVVKLCLRIITETKSFRPTSIAATLRDKTRARFDRFALNPARAVEIGGLAAIAESTRLANYSKSFRSGRNNNRPD